MLGVRYDQILPTPPLVSRSATGPVNNFLDGYLLIDLEPPRDEFRPLYLPNDSAGPRVPDARLPHVDPLDSWLGGGTFDPNDLPVFVGGTPTGGAFRAIDDDRFGSQVEPRAGGSLEYLCDTGWKDFSSSPLFFEPDNVEVMVKILNASGHVNQNWVFAAATTNVEYTLRVVDTQTGEVVRYDNPQGAASPVVADTRAFQTCP